MAWAWLALVVADEPNGDRARATEFGEEPVRRPHAAIAPEELCAQGDFRTGLLPDTARPVRACRSSAGRCSSFWSAPVRERERRPLSPSARPARASRTRHRS